MSTKPIIPSPSPVELPGISDNPTTAEQAVAGFTYSSARNSWSNGVTELTGDCWLRLRLPAKGRVAIRHLYKGQWPIVLMSPYTGPDFEIRIYGKTMGEQIIIETTDKPVEAEIDAI